MLRILSAILMVSVAASDGAAHYNMLFPQAPFAKKGDAVAFVYQWGHPFEHELFDAPSPVALIVLSPDGKRKDLGKALEKIKVAGLDQKMVNAYRFPYVPDRRGDHTIILSTPPIFLAASREFVEDTVKVVLHVTTQKGWDTDPGRRFRIVPITRPYGLLPGMVFQAQVFQDQVAGTVSENAPPLKNAIVEFERYNPTPPKDLPEDELVTFKTKTDAQGIVTMSFPQPGWWCVTAQRAAGTREHDGVQYPLHQRVTLWLHVDEKP